MIEFDASDVDRLADALEEAVPRLLAGARLVVRKTGHDVVRGAQQLAPVDTGHLRSSIGVDIDPDGLGFEAGPTAMYGGFVEWGTSRMSPQPYMMPAFEQQLPVFYEALEQVASRIFD